MRRLLTAEMRKAAGAHTLWWLLLATAAIGVLGTLAPLLATDPSAAELLTDRTLREAMHGAAAGVTLVVVAGIIGMAGDWRFGQVDQTFLTAPVRWRTVTAKAAVYLGVGALYGVAAAITATAAAWGWYRTNGLTLPLDRPAVWLTLAGCVAVAMVFGPLGVAIGAIVRNQTTAIVVALGWMVLVEPALFQVSPSAFRWLPTMASFSLRNMPSDDFLPVGPASAVVLSITVAALVLGAWLVERDDVTG